MATNIARKPQPVVAPSPEAGAAGTCRFCAAPLRHSFIDLGAMPPANNYLRTDDMKRAEPHYPLHAHVCDSCKLVQLEEIQTPEQLFTDYAYFSSFSTSWLDHMKAYAATMTERLGLDTRSLVVEVASNDGYLLKYFLKHGVPVLGVEPAANVARAAIVRDIPTLVRFFGTKLAREMAEAGQKADLLIGNNVLAHVPDINDFVAGLKIVLKESGTITMEFPHLLNMITLDQFDTIYHEHYSYLSFTTVEKIFDHHGLVLTDVETLPTHGGSLRIHARHQGAARPGPRVAAMRAREKAAGLDRIETYQGFSIRAQQIKRDLLRFLIETKDAGKSIVGYGAPAKGNTLLNYCGIGTDFLDYTVDISPHKQGRTLPGSRLPILAPEAIFETRPDYLLILPWNLEQEIIAQMGGIREWGGRFVIPMPKIRIVD